MAKDAVVRKGLPFPVEIPNEVTLQTFADTDQGKNLNYYENVDDLFKKLNA